MADEARHDHTGARTSVFRAPPLRRRTAPSLLAQMRRLGADETLLAEAADTDAPPPRRPGTRGGHPG